MNQLIRNFKKTVNFYLQDDDQPYLLVSVFFIISYPLYYFIWVYYVQIGYENLWLRLVVATLYVPFLFIQYWPQKLQKYRPLYWYFTLLYSLPFLFTFLLLKNNFSHAAELNTLAIITLTILLVDFLPLLMILTLGILLGLLAYYLTNPIVYLPPHFKSIIVPYASVIILGAIFARKRANILKEKAETMKAVAACIAHELRTPLRSILNNANMKTFMPDLIKTYVMAKEAKLSIPLVRNIQLEGALEGLEDIEKEAKYANSIIDMLLINIRGLNDATLDIKIHSMASSINETLERYPFYSEEQKALVTFNSSHDFEFQGDQRLISQILFNLIKNALFFIAKAHKGEIVIQLKSEDRWNCMIFEDTSEGIPKNVLPHIFEQFFSRRENGTGIGLAFCQMAMQKMGGNIRCESEYGVYTRFIMQFPKV